MIGNGKRYTRVKMWSYIGVDVSMRYHGNIPICWFESNHHAATGYVKCGAHPEVYWIYVKIHGGTLPEHISVPQETQFPG